MPVYQCKAIDRGGKTIDFIQEALSEDVILRELSTKGLFPIHIKVADKADKVSRRKRRFSKNSIMEFTDTLTLLFSSGFTLKNALEIAQTIFIKGPVNEIVVRLLEKIKKGNSFNESLNDFGESFPPLYRGLVKVGETAGSLKPVFQRLTEYLKNDKALKEKLISSMMYPVLVLSVAFIGIVIMITFVFPRINAMFSQLGTALPARMEMMMGILNVFLYTVFLLIGAVAALIFVLSVIHKKQNDIARKLDSVILKIPVIGKIKFLKEGLNFLFAMETLTGGGFSIEDSLETSSVVVKNLALRSGILDAREKIIKGENLSQAFIDNPVFPERFVKWISIGEKSGHIEKAFAQLRGYYQNQLEKWFSRFMNLIEPVLILIVGVFIFLIIIFFVMPIFTIYGNI